MRRLALALVCLLAACAACAQVVLEPRWPLAKKLVARLDTQTRSLLSAGAAPRERESRQTLGYSLTCHKRSDAPGVALDVEFNSCDAGPGSPLAVLAGKRGRLLLAPDGKLEKVEGSGAWFDALPGKPRLDDAAARKLCGLELFVQGLDGRGVKPGDTWTHSESTPFSDGGKLKTVLAYKFVGMERRLGLDCAVLDFTGTVAAEGGRGLSITDGKLSGRSLYAPALGLVVSSQTAQDMEIDMALPSGERLKTESHGSVNFEILAVEGR